MSEQDTSAVQRRPWAFYDRETGLFTGRHVVCVARDVERNTPSGCAAIEGRYDKLSQCVDLKTRQVVDYVPPQPDDAHEWNATTKRWHKRADVAIREEQERKTRALIDAIETGSARAIREALLLALPEGQAKARLQEIDDRIAALRPLLTRVH